MHSLSFGHNNKLLCIRNLRVYPSIPPPLSSLIVTQSRARNEDPDQIRMREMARRIATEDYEREKQHQANLTALHAIGPQRKRKLESIESNDSNDGVYSLRESGAASGTSQVRLALLGANRLNLVTPGGAGNSLSRTNSGDSQSILHSSTELSINNNNNTITSSSSHASGPAFSLAHSSRVHRATLRDIQMVLSRTMRLRRTRTHFSTHWRAP